MRDISKNDSLDADVQRLRELIQALGRRRSLRDPIATVVEEQKLTPPQLHVLLWLGTDGALTMGELAKRSGVADKTLTGVVDRLERDGLLQRERDSEDRRVVRANLTRKGATLHKRIDAQMGEQMARVLGVLDPTDRRDLFRILENFLTRISSLDEASATAKEG